MFVAVNDEPKQSSHSQEESVTHVHVQGTALVPKVACIGLNF